METRFDKKFLGQVGLLTGLGAVLPGVAEAAPVCTTSPCVQTQTFSLTMPNVEVNDPGETTNSGTQQTTTVTFAQFDPSLGTLTEIDVNLRSTLAGFLSVGASSTSEQSPFSTATTSWDASVTLTMPGINFFDSQSDSVPCSIQNFGTCNDSKSPSFPETDFEQFLLGSFPAGYVGTGMLNADLKLDLTVSLEFSPTESTSATGRGSATWDPPTEGLIVTYIYTAAATVPEPGTLALLGMGAMAGLGFARRRLKSDG